MGQAQWPWANRPAMGVPAISGAAHIADMGEALWAYALARWTGNPWGKGVGRYAYLPNMPQ